MSSDEGASAAASDWELRHDESSGQAFYLNVKTGESSWDPPAVTDLLLPSADVDPSKQQQQQWVEAFDESGNAYYVNLATMETRWMPPPTAGADSDEPRAPVEATTAAQAHRPRRPSTAEQMAELNRLLSGGDDDDENDGTDLASSGSGGPVASDQGADAAGGGCAWMMFVNEGDGQPYYYNHVTGECMWDPSEEFVQFHNQLQDNKSRPVSPSIPLHTVEAESQAQGSSRLVAVEQLPHVADGVEPAESTSVNLDEKPAGDGNQAAGVEASVGSSADDAVIITPEFEDKVRRAIESVSKTPMGSSRLVFVRTPTGLQLPASTRTADGSEQQVDLQPQLSQRLRSSSSARPDSATARVSNSRPASASPVEELVIKPSQALEIDENAVGDVVDEPLPEAAPSNQAEVPPALESSGVTVSLSDEQRPAAKSQDATHVNVELSDPASAISVDASERESPMPSTEREDSRHSDAETVVSASAVILQCAVRCFVARSKMRSMRKERVDREKQAPEPEQGCNEVNDPMEQAAVAGEDISEQVDSSAADASSSIDATAATATTNADGVAVDVPPTVQRVIPGESPRAETVVNPVNSSDSTPTENAPSDPPGSSAKQVSIAATRSSAAPSVDNVAPVALPGPVASRRSSSRTTARSARAPITTRQRDVACSTPARCPQVLSLARIFPVRSTRIVRDPSEPVALTVSNNAGATAGAVGEAPRKLPPWMQEPTRPAAARTTRQSNGDDRISTSSSSDQRTEAHQPSSIQAAAPSWLSPDLLQQYAYVYRVGQQKFEAERHHLLAERAEQIHSAAGTNQDEATVKEDGAGAPGAAQVYSSEQLWDALEMQDEDEKPNPEDNSAPGNERAHLAVVDPACSDKDSKDTQRRRRRELERRIKLVERSIGRVEAQLEAAELYLVADDDQVPAAKRLLQAKYSSKLRRRLRSLMSSATYWCQVRTELDKGSDKCRSCRPVHTEVLEHRSWSGDSALHYAAWRGWHEQVLRLIEAGTDVNRVDNSVTKWRPLHEASRGGHEAVVRELIVAGASLTAADASGDTALHVACRAGRLKVVCELLLAAVGGTDASSDRRDIKTAVKESVNSATVARAMAFFGIRNGKLRRAIDLATLPTLVAFLEGETQCQVK